MVHGDFVWCDLSSYDPAITKTFYAGLFGWTYQQIEQPDGSGYDIAMSSHAAAAGIFEMPAKFADMGMPSFWMPYIHVKDVEQTCDTAKSLGARVELGPLNWGDFGRVALIRDPLGAGFTVMDGAASEPPAISTHTGHAQHLGLYVSDAAAVIPFYEALFGWRISNGAKNALWDIRSTSGQTVASITEVPDDQRGKEQFWAVHFAVENVKAAVHFVTSHGGAIEYQTTDHALVRDPNRAAFFLTQSSRLRKASAAPYKWRSILALAAVYAALLTDQNWVWGVIFLIWVVPSLRSGETFFVETVRRSENPATFWAIILSWIGLSAMLFLYGWTV